MHYRPCVPGSNWAIKSKLKQRVYRNVPIIKPLLSKCSFCDMRLWVLRGWLGAGRGRGFSSSLLWVPKQSSLVPFSSAPWSDSSCGQLALPNFVMTWRWSFLCALPRIRQAPPSEWQAQDCQHPSQDAGYKWDWWSSPTAMVSTSPHPIKQERLLFMDTLTGNAPFLHGHTHRKCPWVHCYQN